MKLLKRTPLISLGSSPILLKRQHWVGGISGLAVLAFLLAPWSLYDKLWAIAYGICPQRPGHSLFFGEVQMPIEAREGGMFSGFLLGLIFLVIIGRGKAIKLPPPRKLAVLVGFIALMGLDGLNALAYDLYLPTPYTPNLFMRSGTGLLTGLALAGVMVPVFNQTIWEQSKAVASFSTWREIIFAMLLVTIFWAVGLSGWKQLLYPISIVAISGLVILMLYFGVMLASILLRSERRVSNFTELAPLILIGLVAVAIFLAATSTVRYTFFGLGPMAAWR